MRKPPGLPRPAEIEGRRARGGLRREHRRFMGKRRAGLREVGGDGWEKYEVGHVVERLPFIWEEATAGIKEYWDMRDGMDRLMG